MVLGFNRKSRLATLVGLESYTDPLLLKVYNKDGSLGFDYTKSCFNNLDYLAPKGVKVNRGHLFEWPFYLAPFNLSEKDEDKFYLDTVPKNGIWGNKYQHTFQIHESRHYIYFVVKRTKNFPKNGEFVMHPTNARIGDSIKIPGLDNSSYWFVNHVSNFNTELPNVLLNYTLSIWPGNAFAGQITKENFLAKSGTVPISSQLQLLTIDRSHLIKR